MQFKSYNHENNEDELERVNNSFRFRATTPAPSFTFSRSSSLTFGNSLVSKRSGCQRRMCSFMRSLSVLSPGACGLRTYALIAVTERSSTMVGFFNIGQGKLLQLKRSNEGRRFHWRSWSSKSRMTSSLLSILDARACLCFSMSSCSRWKASACLRACSSCRSFQARSSSDRLLAPVSRGGLVLADQSVEL